MKDQDTKVQGQHQQNGDNKSLTSGINSSIFATQGASFSSTGTKYLSNFSLVNRKGGVSLHNSNQVFMQHVHFSHFKQRLASIHLMSRQYWCFTIPIALITMASGILAFIATTEMYTGETQNILTCIVGSLSFVLIFLHTLQINCKYDIRGTMHRNTAIDLRDLQEDLEGIVDHAKATAKKHLAGEKGGSRAAIDQSLTIQGSIADYKQQNHEWMDDAIENIFNNARKQYSQSIKGCKAILPLRISGAFHELNSKLRGLLSEEGHNMLRTMYGPDYNNVIHFQACDSLAAKFVTWWGWPLLLPHSSQLVKDTIDELKKELEIASDFWKSIDPEERNPRT